MNEMIQSFWISGYRSLRNIRFDLSALTIITGGNGAGKTNVYRSLRLLSAASNGSLLEELASEGGMPSITWAGPRKKGPVRLKVGIAYSDLSAEFVLGFVPPVPGGSAFDIDPEIKKEIIWPTNATQHSWLFNREIGAVGIRDFEGHKGVHPRSLGPWEVAFSEMRDVVRFPEVALFRDRLQSWRFYHQFRTDFDSPIRQPALIFRSPILRENGRNLVATMQTIREVGDIDALDKAVSDLTNGGTWSIVFEGMRRMLALHLPGLSRPLLSHEFSDGQLRFLCLAAALLSPRPPYLIVLNEPETSLFSAMIPALAALIKYASKFTQIIITTHDDELVTSLGHGEDVALIGLEKLEGETRIVKDGNDGLWQ